MALEVAYAPEAADDLRRLHDYILERSSVGLAVAYTSRLHRFCQGLGHFPERGSRRDDLAPGLRVVGFERRVTVAFHIDGDRVIIDHLFYGGRSLDHAFASED